MNKIVTRDNLCIMSAIPEANCRGLLSMKTILTLSLFLAAVLHTTAQTTPAANPSILLTTEGRVEVARTGVAAWNPGQPNQTLQTGDRVRTGPKSRATIRLSNLSVLRVNELTTLEIRPALRPDGPTGLDLKSGSTYFFNREKPSDVQFRTPLASGAIRGTEFHLMVAAADGTTTLTLLDGAVDLENNLGKLALAGGEQGIVEPNQPPRKTAVIDAINIIQWGLYYPGVIDADELGLADAEKTALADSLAAYRAGDLLEALAKYPDNRQPGSAAETAYRAATLLAAGQVDQADALLKNAASPSGEALREMIAAVKNQPWKRTAPPALAGEWMAESYWFQSRSRLKEALLAAHSATVKSPGFGFAWVRVAELEFSFGHTDAALSALDRGLALAPRNAQGVSLRGFLLAAQGHIHRAQGYFDQAIALDGGLGNAWLGRGLCKIRQGHAAEGRKDLQVAAAIEPNRAILRSYLGKAFSNARDMAGAEKELKLARKLDPNDPTSWLYSALLHQEGNRVNEAIRDLEKSQELNNNRSLFRSKLLLDQDQAVRSANLAGIYKDAGMFDVSVREAARAVTYDYANFSSHLFLANSYDAIRDPKLFNLRYETPAVSERLIANLLAPVGSGSLSRNVSQQEYSRLFEGDHFGVSSMTQYFDNGDWTEEGSQYGTIGNFSYAFDVSYRFDNGARQNNELEQNYYSLKLKQQITPKDSVYFQVETFNAKSGDIQQYYNQSQASKTLRVKERQEPNLFLGYHHEWSPGMHTLVLASRIDDTLSVREPSPVLLFAKQSGGETVEVSNPSQFTLFNRNAVQLYSIDLQQIWQTEKQTMVLGARYQTGSSQSTNYLEQMPGLGPIPIPKINNDIWRVSFYGYEQVQVLDSLQVTFGLAYDKLHFPANIDTSPISRQETDRDNISPKAGILWTPCPDTHVRAVYTRSLGGFLFDNAVRLEPSQVAGFNQAFRSLASESFVGLVPGTQFETLGLGLDHTIKKTSTYFGLEGEWLRSTGRRAVGVLTNEFPGGPASNIPSLASSTRQSLRYDEKTLLFTVNQLLADEWSVGARYRVSYADLQGRFTDISPGVPGAAGLNQNNQALLHQLNLYLNYNHRCGFFSSLQSVWSSQSNYGTYGPGGTIAGDDFWQINAFVGYRFYRRHVEAQVGVLNLTDRNYKLNPLNLYAELPRERTFAASLKFYF